MKVPFIDLRLQYRSIKADIDEVVMSVLDSGHYINGQYVALLEEKLCSAYGINEAITVGNGTQALECALQSLDVPPGSEVITSAYSWISTAHAILRSGMKPLFVDVADDSFLIDLGRIREKITDQTKILLPVHLFGELVDMKQCRDIADEFNLFLVEDAAQAHFSKKNGEGLGQHADLTILSFYPTKQLGAFGDAGAILTQNSDLADRCRRWGNYGASFPARDYEFAGTNSRMDELQAAILYIKLQKVGDWNRRRRKIAEMYHEQLTGIVDLKLPFFPEGSSIYLYSIRTARRDELRAHLMTAGIDTGVNYDYIIPHTEGYHDAEAYPKASACSVEVLNLPCYPELSDEQILHVCANVKAFFK